MLYKAVAFNNAKDAGNFWTMKFTNTCMSTYCEQPPLYSYLLGRVYALFGSYYLVDRIFTMVLALCLIVLIQRITSKVLKGNFYFLLSLFFLLSVSVLCWSYANQVIEPLVSVFTALGILVFINYVSYKKIVSLLWFALLVYLSFLSKGFQSCFLIVLPFTYFLLDRFSKSSLYFLFGAGLLTALFIFGTLTFYSPAMAWYDCYYNARLVLTINNVGNTTDNHFEIIVRFFTELLIPIAALLVLLFVLRFKKEYRLRIAFKNFAANKLAVALLITSFAGSFPYAISLVQRGFYLIPSFICFVLALVFGFKRYWLFFASALFKLAQMKVIRFSMIAVFIVTIVYSAVCISDYKRDQTLLTDLKIITPYLKNSTTVSLDEDLWNYFSLHAHLYMDKSISLSTGVDQRFYIRAKTRHDEAFPEPFKKLNLPTSELELGIRVSEN